MQTLLMSTGERNFSMALRLGEGVVKDVMKVWRMLTAAAVCSVGITLPVALKWSGEELGGHFETRQTLGRGYRSARNSRRIWSAAPWLWGLPVCAWCGTKGAAA